MKTKKHVRTLAEGRPDSRKAGPAELTVRQGILVKAELGTVCAVEYLRPRGISGDIILRVLDGANMRSEDALALAWNGGVPS